MSALDFAALFAAGDFKAALRSIDAAIHLCSFGGEPQPGQGEAAAAARLWTNKGVCLERLRSGGAAEAAFTRALQWEPAFIEAYHKWALALLAGGKLWDAVNKFKVRDCVCLWLCSVLTMLYVAIGWM